MDISSIIYKEIHKLKLNDIHKELIHYDAKKYVYNIGKMISDRKNYGICDVCTIESFNIIDNSCIMARYKRYKYLVKDYCLDCFIIELSRLNKIDNNLDKIKNLLDKISPNY